MPVYLIIEAQIKDRELYSKYIEKVPAIIERYGGRVRTDCEKGADRFQFERKELEFSLV